MSRVSSLAEAAQCFGFNTGTAMRRAFERGSLPSEFLLRFGPRTLRVDVDGLAAWLREHPAYTPVPKEARP
jgi:hypothetical protein